MLRAVKGWQWWQLLSLLLAIAGVGVAGYLTRTHYDEGALVCGLGDCETVQQSEYAEIAGIPVAILGLSMYLAVIVLCVLRQLRPSSRDPATLVAFGITLAGTLYAAYLTYVELYVIDAICQWCVVSACITLAILLVEGIGVRRWLATGSVDPSDPTG